MLYSHNVAMNIRSCRESLGYSQDYMAEMLDICQSSYANLELGKTSLSLDRLIRISEVLGTDIYRLMEVIKPDQAEIIVDKYKAENSISSTTLQVYDQLIIELKSEINFLRTLIIEKQK